MTAGQRAARRTVPTWGTFAKKPVAVSMQSVVKRRATAAVRGTRAACDTLATLRILKAGLKSRSGGAGARYGVRDALRCALRRFENKLQQTRN